MRRVFLYAITLIVAASCVYPYTPDIKEVADESLVVEAYINIGGTSTVRLSSVRPLDSSGTKSPTGEAYVEDNLGNVYPCYSPGQNIEIPTNGAPADREYRLVITAGGEKYVSDWEKPIPPPTIENVSFSADELMVYVNLTMSELNEGQGFAALYFEEIWDFHADYVQNYVLNPKTMTISSVQEPDMSHYNCWRRETVPGYTLVDYSAVDGNVNDMPVHSFPRTSNRNHSHYRIIVRARNLSSAEYRFRKTLDDNAEIGGNLFQPDPGDMQSNIICETDPDKKVFGYASVSLMSEKRADLDSRYYIHYAQPLVILTEEEFTKYSAWGYEPVTDYFDVVYGIGWGMPRCFDCTAAGGIVGNYNWEE